MRNLRVALVAVTVALGLTACGMFGPSLEQRAIAASEEISAAFAEEEAALADIEAQQAQVQAKIDAAEAKQQPAEDAYFNSDTEEMRRLVEESGALYDAAEAADEAFYDSDWSNDAEYNALEAASEAAWDAYYAAEEEVTALESEYETAYGAAQARLDEDLKPLNKEMERLDALYSASFDGQSFEMAFSLMASCPEFAGVDISGDVEMKDSIAEVDITEGCVTALESWAEKVS